ncbi:MliC family protein [Sulfitobacter sp. EhC04]|uniref:MliC family protein n=1 Tax=Sulfitobacter sp. EhC04 TaxID=1849168 RepID=UPI001F3B1723|nr:MliC family protein [Sulfitobacter sp. EhC04]
MISRALVRRAACLAAFVLPAIAQAEMQVQAMRYTCERGVEVPVVYVNDETGPGIAVIQVEGGMYNLQLEQSASGARYGYPSDGSHYVWWTKDDTALLLWHDGTDGSEKTLLEACERN